MTIAERLLCGAVDDDGLDECGLVRGHVGGHYSIDPAGPISVIRRCLCCRRDTTARRCVCRRCVENGIDPERARDARQRIDAARFDGRPRVSWAEAYLTASSDGEAGP